MGRVEGDERGEGLRQDGWERVNGGRREKGWKGRKG
jgi:hypothetical protein